MVARKTYGRKKSMLKRKTLRRKTLRRKTLRRKTMKGGGPRSNTQITLIDSIMEKRKKFLSGVLPYGMLETKSARSGKSHKVVLCGFSFALGPVTPHASAPRIRKILKSKDSHFLKRMNGIWEKIEHIIEDKDRLEAWRETLQEINASENVDDLDNLEKLVKGSPKKSQRSPPPEESPPPSDDPDEESASWSPERSDPENTGSSTPENTGSSTPENTGSSTPENTESSTPDRGSDVASRSSSASDSDNSGNKWTLKKLKKLKRPKMSMHGKHLKCDNKHVRKWFSTWHGNYVKDFKDSGKVTKYTITLNEYKYTLGYKELKNYLKAYKKSYPDFDPPTEFFTTSRFIKSNLKNCIARIREIENIFKYVDEKGHSKAFNDTIHVTRGANGDESTKEELIKSIMENYKYFDNVWWRWHALKGKEWKGDGMVLFGFKFDGSEGPLESEDAYTMETTIEWGNIQKFLDSKEYDFLEEMNEIWKTLRNILDNEKRREELLDQGRLQKIMESESVDNLDRLKDLLSMT